MQSATNLAQPSESLSLVYSAVSLIISPRSLTASILMPVFVEPTLTELHISSVSASALGIERIRSSSLLVIPLLTTAEYPPIKLTPTSLAALSRTFAIST